ncbi:(3R)-3-hydroxyacyl-CoA dehydrogenase-like [Amblyomma americanum]
MSLRGRLALVTGGSSGIGEAVCHTLASQGASVVVASRRIDAAREVAQSLPGDAKHCGMHVDVGETSSVEELFSNIRAMFPQPVSIVVNSAGIAALSPIVDCTDELFDEIIRVNLKGAFAVTRAACREMVRSGQELPEGGGAIVNVSSTSVKHCSFGSCAYSSSKAGVEALTKSAAKEMATHGIRCNTVLVGLTETPMTAGLSEERRAFLTSQTPQKRAAQPPEIAEAILFLCAPSASSFITGTSLLVSGGFCM